ncbi:uncharacterized protein BDZ99DRAFT_516842 [Mytilinidion resinicola]|uniref:HIT domain-containing protein n=1 Tax=Mytilinidion resinicola TaxID=574789 RepID=A0A6A6Z221_9PEZI|nr:uncharacterized protein BDZ99DRAFT_516842 [Mytilinidion resinicola]KAF2814235.1 hypothetical protein BDZ99DRAFT_516842 [Mytilinidion resinicola]
MRATWGTRGQSETADLFITVKRVGRMLERVYGATVLTILLQDGIDAGQSVPHLHVHVVRRTTADLDHKDGPDAIYTRLEGDNSNLWQQPVQRQRQLRARQPKADEDALQPRQEEEMAAKANMFKYKMKRQEKCG